MRDLVELEKNIRADILAAEAGADVNTVGSFYNVLAGVLAGLQGVMYGEIDQFMLDRFIVSCTDSALWEHGARLGLPRRDGESFDSWRERLLAEQRRGTIAGTLGDWRFFVQRWADTPDIIVDALTYNQAKYLVLNSNIRAPLEDIYRYPQTDGRLLFTVREKSADRCTIELLWWAYGPKTFGSRGVVSIVPPANKLNALVEGGVFLSQDSNHNSGGNYLNATTGILIDFTNYIKSNLPAGQAWEQRAALISRVDITIKLVGRNVGDEGFKARVVDRMADEFLLLSVGDKMLINKLRVAVASADGDEGASVTLPVGDVSPGG